MWSCTLAACAAWRTSVNVQPSPGLSTAIFIAFGKACKSNSNRFASNSAASMYTPVTLPPGRAKLATIPNSIRPSPPPKSHDNRDSASRPFCCHNRWGTHRHDDIHLRTDQLGRKLWKSVEMVTRSANLKRDCLILEVAH